MQCETDVSRSTNVRAMSPAVQVTCVDAAAAAAPTFVFLAIVGLAQTAGAVSSAKRAASTRLKSGAGPAAGSVELPTTSVMPIPTAPMGSTVATSSGVQ